MDSNSPSPFLGLQLSVDAGRQSTDNVAVDLTTLSSTVNTRTASAEGRIGIVPVSRHRAQTNATDVFMTTSDTGPQTSSLKYSFRKLDLTNGSSESAEARAILNRM